MSDGWRPRVLCLPTGPDEYAVAIVRALARVVQVELVLPELMLARYRDDLPPSVRLHPVRWPRHRDPRSLALVAEVVRVARASRPDIVHFLGDSVTWLLLALPLLRCAKVVTVHDVAYHPGDTQSRRVPMGAVRALRRHADALIVHGEGLAESLAATGVNPAGGIHVVDHLVLDRPKRIARRLGLSRRADGERATVLFVGRAMAYKGLGLLLEASDIVVRAVPTARFVVAGQGPELARLSAQLSARPWFEVRDRYIPDEEMAQLLLDADLMALPYLEASQSGVAALAVGMGLPVVATDVGELGALTKATGAGTVVPVRVDLFAEAIIELLSHPDRLHNCRANALNAAEGLLSPERVAEATLSVYAAALSPAPPPRLHGPQANERMHLSRGTVSGGDRHP